MDEDEVLHCLSREARPKQNPLPRSDYNHSVGPKLACFRRHLVEDRVRPPYRSDQRYLT